jgi:hypothetical protein
MPATPYFLVGGGWQDSAGNPLSNGNLFLRLSGPATDLTGKILLSPDVDIEYPLDSNGDISTDPQQSIWPNDQMLPFPSGSLRSSTFYMCRVNSSTGELSWGPNAVSINSSQALLFVKTDEFVADGATAVYVLTEVPLHNSLFVYVGGLQETNYTISGNNLTLGFVPDITSVVSCTYYTDSFVAPVFQRETPAGSGVSFTLSRTPIAGTVALYRNGMFQGPADYAIAGSVITLTSALGSDTLYSIYQTSSNFTTTFQETPTGSINSSNLVFVLSNPALPDSLQFFWNGDRQSAGVDYTLAGDGRTITMVTAPDTGTVRALYNLNSVAIDFSLFVPCNPVPETSPGSSTTTRS